jgi:hypothetical protein
MISNKTYQQIRDDYRKVKDDDRISKSRDYYSSIDTSTGSLSDAQSVRGKMFEDLIKLNDAGELCASIELEIKRNDHDFGAYYTVDIYIASLEVSEDTELYSIVEDYNEAGRDQVEQLIDKYCEV